MKIHHTVSVLTAGFALSPAMASAQPACAEGYERAQEEKANGQLNAALAHLRACVNAGCPKFIREDCARWMDQVEAALPTVVFAVRRDGTDQVEVEITCDGAPLTASLDGKAISVDPGSHNFSFAIPGFSPLERQLLIREGERNRIIEVEFRSQGASAPPASAVSTESVPVGPRTEGGASRRYLAYGLAGLGALGVAGFTIFAVLGNSQQGDLEKSCSPYCQGSQVDSVKTKYLIADTCLGVGLASLGVATYVYITSRGKKSDVRDKKDAVSVSLVPRSVGAGGMLQISTVF